MRRSLFPWVLALLLGACAAEVLPDEVEGTSEALFNAQADTQYPAVGLLWLQSGHPPWCNGTLIAPDIVLTAARCVDAGVEGFYTGPGQLVATAPTTPPTAGFTRHAVMRTLHVEQPGIGPVGLVQLAQPITGITPLPYAYDPLVSRPDVVGYGNNPNGCMLRMSGQMMLATVSSDAIRVSWGGYAVPAIHDMGAPLISAGTVMGVYDSQTYDQVFRRLSVSHLDEALKALDLSCQDDCDDALAQCFDDGGETCYCLRSHQACMAVCGVTVRLPRFCLSARWPLPWRTLPW